MRNVMDWQTLQAMPSIICLAQRPVILRTIFFCCFGHRLDFGCWPNIFRLTPRR